MLIKLAVTNTEILDNKVNSSHLFNKSGGIIGSSNNADWQIFERDSVHCQRIFDKHAEITFVNNKLCVRQLNGEVFVNLATSSLGTNKLVFINNEDVIRLGALKIRILHVSNESTAVSTNTSSLEGMFDDKKIDRVNILDEFSDDVDLHIVPSINEREFKKGYDAMNEDKRYCNMDRDPMAALGSSEKEKSTKNILLVDHQLKQREVIQEPMEGEGTDFEQELERLMSVQESSPTSSADKKVIDGVDKILDILGLYSQELTNEQRERVIFDIAKSLHAIVIGLNKIFVMDNNMKVSLSSLRFQPIEDNPIRSGEDVNNILSEFFLGKEKYVSLSAPSAIGESLELLYNHNIASGMALDAALDSLLESIDPSVLLKRFERYRPMDNRRNPDAWAWMMYRHYYSKLAGNSRLGFAQVFKDVFSQVYDKEMRKLKKENDNESFL